jgi:hypothetical protein
LKEFTQIYETFKKNYENIDSELSNDDKDIIKKKLDPILIQKAEIICKSIKFSVKIMSKLSKHLIEENTKTTKPPTEMLMKTKLFFKITRLIIENSKNSVENSSEKQKEFFKMYIFKFKIFYFNYDFSYKILNL